MKCGTATRPKSKPDTASLFCSCQKCRITPSPTSNPGCHLQKDCTPWIQIPSLCRGATSLAEGMPWSRGSYTQGWFGPWSGRDFGNEMCSRAQTGRWLGIFPRHFFGGVSQNGNLLKLKPFTREGLSEQSSQLRGGKGKSRKVSQNTKKKNFIKGNKERSEKLPLPNNPGGKVQGLAGRDSCFSHCK